MKNAKIAILVLADKNPLYIRELINKLASEDVAIFLHLDPKAGDAAQFIPQGKSTMLIEPRRRCPWGEEFIIDAITDLLTASRKYAPSAQYVSLISGQDWPLLEPSELANQLIKGGSAGHMSAKQLPADDLADGGLPRMTRYWVPLRVRPNIFRRNVQRVLNKLCPLRSLDNLPPLYYGSLWFDLRFDIVDYILAYIEQHPQYRQAYRWSYCADEIFFHTIILNSPFADEISLVCEPDQSLFGLRFIDWAHRTPTGHPRGLDSSDLSQARSTGALFARKFEAPPE
jgi:hypothetical protein